jgi:twinkle protein
MWVFNIVGNATIARLLEVFRYAAKRYGIGHFVIDSLMKTDVPADGPGFISAQTKAMNALTEFANAYSVHVHLVAHPRKLKDESGAPGKLDVAGSGTISNQADNLFSVWSANRDDDAEQTDKTDALIELQKQRNGDVQHKKFWLWFDRASQQYCGTSERRPVPYVPFDGAAPYFAEVAA